MGGSAVALSAACSGVTLRRDGRLSASAHRSSKALFIMRKHLVCFICRSIEDSHVSHRRYVFAMNQTKTLSHPSLEMKANQPAQGHELLRFLWQRLDQEQLPQVAGSLTFTTVLALVPMLTIALAILTSFPVFKTFRTALEAYFIQSLMPQTMANTILGYLNQFAAKATRLSAVGGAGLMVTSVMMIGMVEHTFNHLWRVKTRRPPLQRLIVYWAIITLGPLLIGLSMTITSYAFTVTGGAATNLHWAGALFYTLASVALTTGAFTLLYTVVPNQVVDWRDAAWGGLVAAVAFEIAKRLFAIFITQFPTYTVVYGALAAVPIFLVWIYVSWFIALVGGIIAATLPILRHERWWHTATPASAFIDAMAVLAVLYEARAFSGSAAVDAHTIRIKTRLGFDEIENLLDKMLNAGWVGQLNTLLPKRMSWGRHRPAGRATWTLLIHPQQLTIADVYRLFMFPPSGNSMLAETVEGAIEQGLTQSLAMYFAQTGNV